tara:strand:+ start:439 stop:594 length:156 start_codon:yes stop_codon:yes gene_type:complete
MLKYNPEDRISASDALQHAWIKKYSESNIDINITKNTLNNLRNFSGASKLK